MAKADDNKLCHDAPRLFEESQSDTVRTVRKLRRQGMSETQVAKATGLPIERVRRIDAEDGR